MAKWIPILGLSEWHITVEMSRTEPDADEWAVTHVLGNYRRARIVFQEDGDAPSIMGKHVVEMTVIHELMHVVLSEIDHATTSAVTVLAGKESAVSAIALKAHDAAHERVADALSISLYRAFGERSRMESNGQHPEPQPTP